jgi:phospholipid transport system transporter-binding protein
MSEPCTIEVDEQGCAYLTGALTFESTPGLFGETEKLLTGHATVSSVDLSGVTAVDSAGLALLLEWQASQRLASNRLRFIHSPSALMSLARLCEAVELLNMTGRNHQP